MSAIVYDEPYKLPAGILAVAVHGAFFALLYFGFSWQTQPATPMSVELWDSLPGAAVIPPAQVVVEEVAPAIKPEVVEPPQPEKIIPPDIVLPDKHKLKPVIKKPEKVIAKPDKKKAAPGVTGGVADGIAAGQLSGSSITDLMARERSALAAARVMDEYIGKIAAKIRSNIVKPPDVADNARAEFLVTLLPGGAVLSARLTKSSGNPAYDNAVDRAILKSQPLPLPTDVTMFSKFREIRLGFNSKEQE